MRIYLDLVVLSVVGATYTLGSRNKDTVTSSVPKTVLPKPTMSPSRNKMTKPMTRSSQPPRFAQSTITISQVLARPQITTNTITSIHITTNANTNATSDDSNITVDSNATTTTTSGPTTTTLAGYICIMTINTELCKNTYIQIPSCNVSVKLDMCGIEFTTPTCEYKRLIEGTPLVVQQKLCNFTIDVPICNGTFNVPVCPIPFKCNMTVISPTCKQNIKTPGCGAVVPLPRCGVTLKMPKCKWEFVPQGELIEIVRHKCKFLRPAPVCNGTFNLPECTPDFICMMTLITPNCNLTFPNPGCNRRRDLRCGIWVKFPKCDTDFPTTNLLMEVGISYCKYRCDVPIPIAITPTSFNVLTDMKTCMSIVLQLPLLSTSQ